MDTKRVVVLSLLATASLFSAGSSVAADTDEPTPPAAGWRHPMMGAAPPMGRPFAGPGMPGCPLGAGGPMGPMGAGMMGPGMMGPMMGMAALPPGNEKIAMQMHGEMMKAMGDILMKYADKIQIPAPPAAPASPAR